MNERIKELAEQAGVYFGEAHKDYFGEEHPAFVSIRDMDFEKFAELIVRECMNLCSEVKEDLELVPDKLEREAAEMGVTFCYEAIKGEFGVEE
jgi:hypothetical protein